MRQIVKNKEINNIVEWSNFKFNPNKIYICIINDKITKLTSIDCNNNYIFSELNNSFQGHFYTGGEFETKISPEYLLENYSKYELYEFDDIKEFANWLDNKVNHGK